MCLKITLLANVEKRDNSLLFKYDETIEFEFIGY